MRSASLTLGVLFQVHSEPNSPPFRPTSPTLRIADLSLAAKALFCVFSEKPTLAPCLAAFSQGRQGKSSVSFPARCRMPSVAPLGFVMDVPLPLAASMVSAELAAEACGLLRFPVPVLRLWPKGERAG